MRIHRFWASGAAVALVVVLATAVLVSCYTVPETGRKSLILIPESQELALGLSAYNEARSQTPISDDPRYNAQVRRVGTRVASVAGRDYYEWDFTVFDQPDIVNAWCLPGGKIGFYTGIMPLCDSDAGVATVMAHEVGHAVARHGAERMSLGLVLLAGQAAVAVATKDEERKNREMIMAAYGIGTTLFVQLPYSRKHEYEADRIGLMLMADAGYDPRESVYFWTRMMKYGEARGGAPPEFLSTHPSDAHRIAQLQQYMPEALDRYYKATGLGPPPGSASTSSGGTTTTAASGTTLRSAPILRTGVAR
jgi:predicted Zn-dependent protease